MIVRPLIALVRKDLQVVFSDRYALVLSFAAPVALASFMAVIFGGAGPSPPSRVAIRVVDEDAGEVSRAVAERIRSDPALAATISDRDPALAAVRQGEAVLAVVIPRGFGEAASAAIDGGGEPPPLDLVLDPTRQSDLGMVRGVLTRAILESVSASALGGEGSLLGLLSGLDDADPADEPSPRFDDHVARAEFLALFPPSVDDPDKPGLLDTDLVAAFPGLEDWETADATEPAPAEPIEPAPLPAGGFTLPFVSREQSITGGGSEGERQALAAHAFSGMVVQFVLFSAVEWGIALINERQRGLWKRLRSAPVGRLTLLVSKAIGCAIMSLLISLFVFGSGMLIFGFRIRGSAAGFVAIAAAYALTAATFGLMVAAIGRSPNGSRSVSILVVLVMVLLGGGWIPSFLFPEWLQAVTPAMPTRWAIDGFSGVLARGFRWSECLPPLAALGGFTALFALVATVSQRKLEPTG